MNEQELTGIHKELVEKEKAAIANREAFENFMKVSGFMEYTSLDGEQHFESNGHQEDTPEQVEVDLSGLPIRDALVAYARANGGVLSCGPCAQALMDSGVGHYKSVESAQSSFYALLKKNTAVWTKIGPGAFRLNDARSKADKRWNPSVRNRRLAPMAVNRDYSLCTLPPQFRNFDLDSIRGKSYKDAAVAIARYAGGEITMQDIGRVFWHADLCGRATNPQSIGAYIWTAAFAPGSGLFTALSEKGRYRLIQ
jgi:hypothetical protein